MLDLISLTSFPCADSTSPKGGFKLQRGNSRDLSQPLIANIHSLKEVRMEEKNQQERFLGVDREWGDDPEGRVKVGSSLTSVLSSSPSDSSLENSYPRLSFSPLTRPSGLLEFRGSSLTSLLSSSPSDSSLENSYPRLSPSPLTRPSGLLESGGSCPLSPIYIVSKK
jgi:hypothetical protein